MNQLNKLQTRVNSNRLTKPKIGVNSKGVFITISALLLASMLLLGAANLQKLRTLEENATTIAIASQRNYSVKETLLDSIMSIYSDSGIKWNFDGNAFTYKEDMPNTTARNKISTNLSKLGSFFYNEFPNNPNFIPQNIDPAKIQIYGKDMNITHSTTTGFGNDQNIYFNYTTPNFSRIQFDVNTSAGNLTQLSAPSFPSCSGCQYPVLLIINVRNSAGSLVYSFNSIVDINKNGVLDLNSTPTSPDLQLRYSPKLINWQTNSSSINLLTQINFNDPYLEIGIDKAAIRIDEMSSFGVQG